jgi:GNAT superfamily N-acetyltransferase
MPISAAFKGQLFLTDHLVFPEGFIVAELDGQIIAYASSERWTVEREPHIDEDPIDTHHPDGRVFCITAMAVDPGHQNHGVGTALLQYLMQFARVCGCERVVLETSQARRFYESRGFSCNAERWHGDTRLYVMSCTL